MTGRLFSIALFGFLLLVAASPAAASTIYKCIAPDGHVVYQDAPCPHSQHQQTIRLPDVVPVAPRPLPPKAPSPTVEPEPEPAPSPPATPLPQLYACQNATNGKTYLSRNGYPQPYLAPFGVLGALQQPLGEVYGRGGAGASAPELNRGRITSGLVANHYVWVQDLCRPLSREETCEALQNAYDENEHKLRQAFKSERAPFERREAELRAQLTNC